MQALESEAEHRYSESQLLPVTFLLGGLGIEPGIAVPAGVWALVAPEWAAASEHEQIARFGAVFYVPGIQSPFSITDAVGPGRGRSEPRSWWSVPDAAGLLCRNEETIHRLCRESRLERRGAPGSFEVSGASLFAYHHDPASLVRVNATRPAPEPVPGRDSYVVQVEPGQHVVQSSFRGTLPQPRSLDVAGRAPRAPGNTPRPFERLGQEEGVHRHSVISPEPGGAL